MTKAQPTLNLSATSLTFDTPVKAWEYLNEAFIRKDKDLFSGPGKSGSLTNTLYAYNVFLNIETPKFEPKFDFGLYFKFTQTKWTGLVSNYINLDNIDKVRNHVRELDSDPGSRSRGYTIAFQFTDSHGHGKGCLVSGICSRSIGIEEPTLTVILRSSEVTTRLAMDLVFLCRLGHYIFGHRKFKLQLILKQAYADDSMVLMYHKRKPIEEVIKGGDKERGKALLERLKQIQEGTENQFAKYQPYLRAFKVLRSDLYPEKHLLAKDCKIGNWDDIPLPEVCPTVAERNLYKKSILKFKEKFGVDFRNIAFRAPEKKKKKTYSA